MLSPHFFVFGPQVRTRPPNATALAAAQRDGSERAPLPPPGPLGAPSAAAQAAVQRPSWRTRMWCSVSACMRLLPVIRAVCGTGVVFCGPGSVMWVHGAMPGPAGAMWARFRSRRGSSQSPARTRSLVRQGRKSWRFCEIVSPVCGTMVICELASVLS
jgi:hypothetical protein